MKTAAKIAWRFLTHAKGQSILIAVGIAVGVSVQVFIGSLISGLQVELVDTAIGRNTQVTVSALKRGETVEDYQAVVDQIVETRSDVEDVSPVVDASGFLRNSQRDDFPIQLRDDRAALSLDLAKFRMTWTEFELQLRDRLIEFGEAVAKNQHGRAVEPVGGGGGSASQSQVDALQAKVDAMPALAVVTDPAQAPAGTIAVVAIP